MPRVQNDQHFAELRKALTTFGSATWVRTISKHALTLYGTGIPNHPKMIPNGHGFDHLPFDNLLHNELENHHLIN